MIKNNNIVKISHKNINLANKKSQTCVKKTHKYKLKVIKM